MSEHTHGSPTPGPWQARRGSGNSEHAFQILSTQESSAGITLIANIAGRDFATREANARLIAAAPKLLAALEAIVTWDDSCEMYDLEALDELPGIVDAAREAIKEAKE